MVQGSLRALALDLARALALALDLARALALALDWAKAKAKASVMDSALECWTQ